MLEIAHPLITAMIVGMGCLAVAITSRWKWMLAALLLLIVTPVALPGFWPNGQLGVSDWDYYFSYHHVVRTLVVEHGVFPHWNPYICGGTSGVGDPEFPLFAPTFLLELAFGVPVGLRLAIFATTAGGAIGMLLLGKRLGLSVFASLLAGLAYGFGSVNLLEVVEGHPNVFSAAYVPWVLWAWLTAYRSTSKVHSMRWSILLAVLLALMFMQGGIYMLMYTVGAFGFLILVARNKWTALRIVLVAGLVALGLAAIKLFPVMYWLSQFQDEKYASSALTLPYLNEIFLGRHLHGVAYDDIIPDQGGGWHEYGAYLGPYVLLFAAVGFVVQWRRRVILWLAVASIVAILLSSTGPILKPFFDQAPWFPRSNISRLILFAVIPLSLLAGYGLDQLRTTISHLSIFRNIERSHTSRLLRTISTIVVIALLSLVSHDLTSLSTELSKQAFILPPPIEPITRAQTPLQFTIHDNTTRHKGVDYTRAYGYIAKGYGTQSYCTVLGPQPSVSTLQHHDHNLSYVQVNDPDGTAELVSWSPHTFVTHVSVTSDAEVKINSNYAPGWTVNYVPAKDVAGRLTINVPAGKHELTWRYRAPWFVTGFAVSVITIVITALVLLKITSFGGGLLAARHSQKQSTDHDNN